MSRATERIAKNSEIIHSSSSCGHHPVAGMKLPAAQVPTKPCQNDKTMNIPHHCKHPSRPNLNSSHVGNLIETTGTMALLWKKYEAVKGECEEFRTRREFIEGRSGTAADTYMQRREGAPPHTVEIFYDNRPAIDHEFSKLPLETKIRQQELRNEMQHLTLKKYNVCREISHAKNAILRKQLRESAKDCFDLREKLLGCCHTITRLQHANTMLIGNIPSPKVSVADANGTCGNQSPGTGPLAAREILQQRKVSLNILSSKESAVDATPQLVHVQRFEEPTPATQVHLPSRPNSNESRVKSAELVNLTHLNHVLRHQVANLHNEAAENKMNANEENTSIIEKLKRLQITNRELERLNLESIKGQKRQFEIYNKKCKAHQKTIAHLRLTSKTSRRRAGSIMRRLRQNIAELNRKIKLDKRQAKTSVRILQREVTRLNKIVAELQREIFMINKDANEIRRIASEKSMAQQARIDGLEFQNEQLERQLLSVTHDHQENSNLNENINFALKLAILSLTMSNRLNLRGKDELPQQQTRQENPHSSSNQALIGRELTKINDVDSECHNTETQTNHAREKRVHADSFKIGSQSHPGESNAIEQDLGHGCQIKEIEHERIPQIYENYHGRISQINKTHEVFEMKKPPSLTQIATPQFPTLEFREVERAGSAHLDTTFCHGANEPQDISQHDESGHIVDMEKSTNSIQDATIRNSNNWIQRNSIEIEGSNKSVDKDAGKHAAICEALYLLTGKDKIAPRGDSSKSCRDHKTYSREHVQDYQTKLHKRGSGPEARMVQHHEIKSLLPKFHDVGYSEYSKHSPPPTEREKENENAAQWKSHQNRRSPDNSGFHAPNLEKDGKLNEICWNFQEKLSKSLMPANLSRSEQNIVNTLRIVKRNGILELRLDTGPSIPDRLSMTRENRQAGSFEGRTNSSFSCASASASLCAITSKMRASDPHEEVPRCLVDDLLSKNLALEIESHSMDETRLRMVSAPVLEAVLYEGDQSADSPNELDTININTRGSADSQSQESNIDVDSCSTSTAQRSHLIGNEANESFGDLLGGMLSASITENTTKWTARNFKMSQLEIGKWLSNSWSSNNKLITYSPKVFADLRSIFGINDDTLLNSLGGTFHRKRDQNIPSDNYYSSDNRYIIQPITKSELRKVATMLWQYHTYMKANPNSLLPQYYGMYWARVRGGDQVDQSLYFVLMNNVINTNHRIDKLSLFCGSAADDIQRLKDQGHLSGSEWIENEIEMKINPLQRTLLYKQFSSDVKFLEEQYARNYQLLIAVRDPRVCHKSKETLRQDQEGFNRGHEDDSDLDSLFFASKLFQHHDGGLRGFGGELAPVYYVGIVDCLKASPARIGWSTRSIQAVKYGERIVEFFARMLDVPL